MSTVIEFEDYGQGYTQWTINNRHVIETCAPSLGWMWCGGRVVSNRIEIGEPLRVRTNLGTLTTTAAPVRAVRQTEAV